ncbi:MAG TPA: sterol desaturase family protein [Steroidobacteraceae bacterium]|nr:sterol desaturase family protein [Steroidobacteraceae bacterium]
MFTTWILERWAWPGLLTFSVTLSLLFYGLGAGASYYWHFRYNRSRLMPDYVPNWRENRKAIWLSVINVIGSGLLILPLQLAVFSGHSQLYGPLMQRGWSWAVLSIAGALVFAETGIYWIHRVLHTPFLFRWLHHRHHRFRMPTPFVGFASHPLDSFALTIPYHLYAFLVPMPEVAYLGFIGLASVWTLLIHDRVVWVPPRLVNNTGCHTVHHWYARHNYGNYFTFWDRLGNTYFDPMGLPRQFFAAKHGERRRRAAGAVCEAQHPTAAHDIAPATTAGTTSVPGTP